MNKKYSSRQSKIYSDYSIYPSEKLEEIIKSNKYVNSVKEIIKDILDERQELENNYPSIKEQMLSPETNDSYLIKDKVGEINIGKNKSKKNILALFVRFAYLLTLFSIIMVIYMFSNQDNNIIIKYGVDTMSSKPNESGNYYITHSGNYLIFQGKVYPLGLSEKALNLQSDKNKSPVWDICQIVELKSIEPKEYAILSLSTGKLLEGTAFFIDKDETIFKVTHENVIPIKGNISIFLLKMGIKQGIKISLSNPPNLFVILIPLIIAIIGHIAMGLKKVNLKKLNIP